MTMQMPTMDWAFKPLPEALKIFKARIELYFEDQNIQDAGKRATKIKVAIGDEGMRRLLNSGLTEEEKKLPDKIWELLENEVDYTVKISFRVHRLEFAGIRQDKEESIQQYVARLREKAAKCSFEPDELNERLIEMVITSTQNEEFRKELLTKPKGTKINTIIERGREHEAIIASQASLKAMNQNTATAEHEPSDTAKVDALKRIQRTQNPRMKKPCQNCGRIHPPRSCPAYNDLCHGCGSMGHWQKYCRKSKSANASKKDNLRPPPKRENDRYRARRNHEIDFNQDEEEDTPSTVYYTIAMADIKKQEQDPEAFVTLEIKHQHVTTKKPHLRLKVDTGAGGNTLPLRTYQQMFKTQPSSIILQPEPTLKLTSYSGDRIPCIGSLLMGIKKPNDSSFTYVRFYVVKVDGPAILGLPSCRKLGIVTLNLSQIATTTSAKPTKTEKKITEPIRSVQQIKEAYPNQFDRVGTLKEPAKLYTREDAMPSCDAPRRVSIHLKPKIKEELGKLEKDNIIRKLDVNEHSDWCSSLVYVTKPNGELRICLDPKKLNQNLKRYPHKIPTLEEINPIFSEATVFSKLDAKAGYWSVPLHEDSQLLTTFRTPFGRYCWKRLPFGLNVSQDIFQARMDMMTEGLEGVANIADDFGIAGKGQGDHDTKLLALMDRAEEYGLSFNSPKCDISKPEISFFGNKYSKDGLRPDPNKVNDLRNMPSPQNKEDLHKIIGLMTYLSSFIPNFSRKCETLRNLLKKDVPFAWEADHEHQLNALKEEITDQTVLQFYNPSVTLTLEVDASQKGLGAAIKQNNKPIAFASKALTKTQAGYSNIEREALGLVHGVQRYHHYLYAKKFVALTDHKPLVDIWKKPLTSAPPRLQRLFLRLQGYDMDLQYCKGADMTLSDTLSRLPCNGDQDIHLDKRVDGVKVDDLDAQPIMLLNFTQDRLRAIKQETAEDPELRLLTQRIIEGWPDDIKKCSPEIRPYFSFRETLAIEDGVIFKGRQVLIPRPSQKEILRQLHTSHQGIKKTQWLARESVYWRNINKDIETLITKCETCQKYQPNQSQEPTLHHSIPPAAWWKIGSDLYHIGNKDFLILVDYFSKYPIVAELGVLTSKAVVGAIKTTCSMFGAPKELISDNGPQYSSKEFKQFTNEWGIKHNPSSPVYPKSNGLAERTIQTVKKLIKKCTETGNDISEALLHLRATPIDASTKSPAELMFGRQLVTMLPSRTEPSLTDMETRNHLFNRLQEKNGKELPELLQGQPVRVRDPITKTWIPGTVTQRTAHPRSYIVSTEQGQQLRRNRLHIRSTPSGGDNDNTQTNHNTPEENPSKYTQSASSVDEDTSQSVTTDKDVSQTENILPTVRRTTSPDAPHPQVAIPKLPPTSRSGRTIKPKTKLDL